MKNNKSNITRLKIKQKLIFRVPALMVIFFSVIALIYFQFTNVKPTYAVSIGDYRAVATGNWESISTWQTFNGTSWVAASSTPNSSNGAIEIQPLYTVTITVNKTVDQVTIDAGGMLVIATGITLTLVDGAGDDLTDNGTMTINGTLLASGSNTVIGGIVTVASGGFLSTTSGATINVNSGSTLVNNGGTFPSSGTIVNSGGTYQHNANGNTVATCTWNTGSNCLISGITSTALSTTGLNQSYYNFTWNCPSQTATVNLKGNIKTVNGNLNVISTGTGAVALSYAELYTLNIGGNFTLQAGTVYGTRAPAPIINITGNYVQSGGIFAGTDSAGPGSGGGTPTINVTGSFSISAGTFRMNAYLGSTSGSGITTLNLFGNFSQTGGTITEIANTGTTFGYGQINFINSGTATFTQSSGTIINTINCTVFNGDTLNMITNANLNNLSINSGGILNVASGKTLTMANGTGTDLTVNGILNAAGTLALSSSSAAVINGTVTVSGAVTITTGATININSGGQFRDDYGTVTTTAGCWIVNSGGVYQSNKDADVLPLATWNTGSTCLVTGDTTAAPSNLGQSFYNFTWNCPRMNVSQDFGASLTTVRGDLTFASTGTALIRFDVHSGLTVNVGGNFYMQGGSAFLCTDGTTDVLNVAGNFVVTGGYFGGTELTYPSDFGAGIPTINITGNLNISGGTFDLNQNTTTSSGKGCTTVNLYGNYIQSGGTLTETSVNGALYGIENFNFANPGLQTFTKTGGTMSNMINFTVKSASILDMQTSILTGTGTFTLSNGGGVMLGDPNGITKTALSGNVKVTGTRTYNTGADYTYEGTVTQVTGDGLPATVHNLTITDSSNVTLTSNVSISNIFSLTNGNLITPSDTVKVTNSATSAIVSYSSSSYVQGNLTRNINTSGSYDFPVGSTTNYELINLTSSSLAGVSAITASFSTSNPGTIPNGLTHNHGTPVTQLLNMGYWTLSPTGTLSSGNYSVSAYATGATNASDNNISYYTLLKRHDNSANWDTTGTDNIALNNYGQNVNIFKNNQGTQIKTLRSGYNTFSHFGIGYGGSTLPIELIYFNAKINLDLVDLKWATASELNNDYFTIERSPDGKTFTEILRQHGAGNSTSTINYSAVDQNPFKGISYYRLKQTDFDGKNTYSEVKSIRNDVKVDTQLAIQSIGPNPFYDSFNINYFVEMQGAVELQITNYSGLKVYKENIYANKGYNTFSFIDKTNLPAGVYFVTITSCGETVTKKLIKQ